MTHASACLIVPLCEHSSTDSYYQRMTLKRWRNRTYVLQNTLTLSTGDSRKRCIYKDGRRTTWSQVLDNPLSSASCACESDMRLLFPPPHALHIE